MLRQLFYIGKYTVIEGIRDKILYVSLFIIIGLLMFSSYLSLLTLTSPDIAFLSFSFYFLKLFSIIALLFLIIFHLYRDKKNRAYEIILTKIYKRSLYIWGKFLGFNILYILITTLVVLVIFLLEYILWNKLFYSIFVYIPILSFQFFIISSIVFLLYLIFTSPTITIIISIAILFASHFSIDFYLFTMKTSNGLIKYLYILLYYIFPNLQCFAVEKSIVHKIPMVPLSISNLFLYAISYGIVFVFITGLIFENKRDY